MADAREERERLAALGYGVRCCQGTHWHATVGGLDLIGTYATEAHA